MNSEQNSLIKNNDIGPVDLVCCWVRMDEEYVVTLEKTLGRSKGEGMHPGRFRELGEILYSVPMAIKNMPWLRKVFIVTNGQKPPEAILNCPKVEWVTHEEIIPTEYLPTFSYHSIEPFVVNIPDLSEKFILTADDFFVANPLVLKDFTGNHGAGVYLHTRLALEAETPKNVWQHNLKQSHAALTDAHGDVARCVFPHAPQLFSRTQWKESLDTHWEYVGETVKNKLRQEGDVVFRILCSYDHIYKQWGVKDFKELVEASDRDVRHCTRKEYIPIALHRVDNELEASLEKLRSFDPTFFCLNDAVATDSFELMCKKLSDFLSNYSTEDDQTFAA